ncbi:MAG: hypothetical protein NC548_39835 [Lachnospiraceae bacterium]|nr:hypothetical protein [Lachnospiraceae bacterium]
MAEYRSTLDPEYQLAIWLHDHLCHSNHTDGCGWSYEIDGIRDKWENYVHKEYLEMAKRMMLQCSDITLIKNIIGSIEEEK